MVHFFSHSVWASPKPRGLGWWLGLGWALGLWLLPAPALAAQTQLQWQGEQGYQVKADLTYPDTFTTGMAAIEGVGKPQHLEAVTVRVYDPNGQELATYHNVTAGRPAQDDFLQLHFDVAQQQVRGWLDIGGAVRDDYFLKGQPGVGLDLFYIGAGGKERKVDHNGGQVSVVLE